MDSPFGWSEQQAETTEMISGERRSDRRYQLQLPLRWKLIRRRRVLEVGEGHTLDLSSGGILFEAGRPMPKGLNVELSIVWPVLLHDVAPLQLAASGRVVRSEDGRVAIRMVQHEFRTLGVAAEHRGALAAAAHTPGALLANYACAGGLGKPH